MQHKKSVTSAVCAANRCNAQSSTGPKTDQGKSNSSHNAVRHGILARKIVLETHQQRAVFRELRQRCKTELCPEGLIEEFVVEEIVTLFWKLGIVEGLEVRELLRRQELSDDVDDIFRKELKLPISDYDLPLDRGWDIERMVVRAVAGKDQRQSESAHGSGIVQGQAAHLLKKSLNDDHKKVNHLEIEAVMGSTLENMTRYQAKLKRDLYRAIKTLREVQAERRKASTDASHSDSDS